MSYLLISPIENYLLTTHEPIISYMLPVLLLISYSMLRTAAPAAMASQSFQSDLLTEDAPLVESAPSLESQLSAGSPSPSDPQTAIINGGWSEWGA